MKMRFLYSQKHRDHSIAQTTRLVTISALSCPAQANNPIVKGLAILWIQSAPPVFVNR